MQIGGLSGSLFNSTAAASTLRSIVTATNQNLFADEYTRIVNRSITAQAVFQTAFTAATVTAPTNCVQPSTGNNQASTDLATISPTWATSRRPISAF